MCLIKTKYICTAITPILCFCKKNDYQLGRNKIILEIFYAKTGISNSQKCCKQTLAAKYKLEIEDLDLKKIKILYFWVSPFNVFSRSTYSLSLSLSLCCSVSCCMNVELETEMNYLINLHNFAQLTREELLMNIYTEIMYSN